jgi:peptidoglycan hydrolase CwlO-like protein
MSPIAIQSSRGRLASLVLVTALMLALAAPAASAASRGGEAGAVPSSHSGGRDGRSGGAPLTVAQQRLSQLEHEIAREQSAVVDVQRQLGRASLALGQEQAAYDATQARLTQIREELAAAQTEYAALRQRLDDRAAQALVIDSGPRMEFLLESSSFSDVSDRLEFLNQLQVSDAALAARVASQARDLAHRRADLAATLHQQADVVGRLDARQQAATALFVDEQQRLARIASERRRATALVARLTQRRSQRAAGAASALDASAIGGEVAPYGQWARLFLQHIGAPACRDNLVALVAWQAAEGTSAAWNPLATTLPMPGSTAFNSAGVQNYDSLAQGLDAIQSTLVRGASTFGYGAVLSSLSACSSATTTAAAINASSWCRGCAGGAYVTGLIPMVETYFDTYAATSTG